MKKINDFEKAKLRNAIEIRLNAICVYEEILRVDHKKDTRKEILSLLKEGLYKKK